MSRRLWPAKAGHVVFALALVLFMACTSSIETETGTAETTPELQPEISLFFTPTPAPTPAPDPPETPTPVQDSTLPSTPVLSNSPFGDQPDQYLLFNQRIIEGLQSQDLDIGNVDQVFSHVFNGLPDEVTVYPSENYYYFVLYAEERQFWGNIRLPAGARENGELSFAYFEFEEFPIGQRSGITRSKFYNEPDGVFVREIDRFTWEVEYQGKSVIFNLHQLRQDRPQSFPLAQGETYIQRTFDESGIQFFLLFNRVENYFFWVLNEEEIVGDTLIDLEGQDDFLIGKKSGFVFWIDRDHGNRKVLAAIRRLSVNRNDYYDGPFDQLADNYAAETGVSEFMQRAYPGLRDRIDMFGYYTDQERPLRVAISTYYTYLSTIDLNQFIERMRLADDPYQFISRGGVPVTPTTFVPTAIPPTEVPAATVTP